MDVKKKLLDAEDMLTFFVNVNVSHKFFMIFYCSKNQAKTEFILKEFLKKN